MKASALRFLCVLCVSAVSICAQTPGFLSDSTLVEVNVIVRDRDGRPLTDLRQEDFSVFENGRGRQITSFSRPGDAPPPGPPRIPFPAQNRPRAAQAAGPWTAFLLDNVGAEALNTVDAVLSEIPPERRIAVFKVGSGFSIIRSFDHARPQPDAQSQTSLTARDCLLVLARHLEGFPGRRDIVWITRSASRPGSVIGRDLLRALARANVSVSIIEIEAPASSPDRAAFAAATGGEVWSGGDLAAGIRRAIEAPRLGYTLAYDPGVPGRSGAFRTITVRVAREGARLTHRSGFWAGAEAAARDRASDIDAALAAPFDVAGIGLLLDPTGTRMRSGAAQLKLRVNPDDLILNRSSTGRECQVELVLAQEDGERNLIAISTDRLGFEAGEEALRRLGLIVHRRIEPLAETGRLRVVVRDVRSGRLGSLTIPVAALTAPALKQRGAAAPIQ